ncbi:hypothetical protein [Phocaeicola plebeius]|uniref:hypothetical protein n=1 Tax=Phocaeicola plebeius TaxID=310297 RepID=UPI0026F0A4EF|nr:hypothetical protein [Phocaeicola plebeius]
MKKNNCFNVNLHFWIWLSFLFFTLPVIGQKKINITDFGFVKDSYNNVMPALKKALKFCKEHPGTTLVFPNGRYDFWPMRDKETESNIGFDLSCFENFTLDGDGSEFIFHSWMGIAQVNHCTNITFKNFSVDWDRPWISQAVIMESSEHHLDVKIDRKKYPYIIENKRIYFIGEGCKLPILNVYNNLYDKQNKEILYNTWDSPLGNFAESDAEELDNGIVRFHVKSPNHPEKGTIVTLYHAHYGISGFLLKNSKDIVLRNMQIYHTVGNGVWGVRTENITMDNTSVMVNRAKGRVFSSVADASHFTSCKGTIIIENCAHTGQGDDFINVHGRNLIITKILNPKELEVKSINEEVVPNDEVWFLDKVLAQRGELRTIMTVASSKDANHYIVSFDRDIPVSTKVGDFLESKTWTPSLILKNCRILKKNRARGILVTTPKEVRIENNYFRTAGTAILIEGDIDYWLESGGTQNVKIHNNIFEDCLTSGNAHGSRWEWGDAVITITPSHKPQNVKTKPYHKNIHITNNTFKVFDAPLLRARSVEGLEFCNNEIIKTYTYKPYTWQKAAFLLDGCRKVKIESNKLDRNYVTRDIVIEHMLKSDIEVSKEEFHPIVIK